ncbi:reverse transcriptase domain-containing protein [Tanacetum coccineum]
MTNGRETTSPPGFLTPPHIPNINTTDRPPVTTTVYAATTLGNTPFAYRASTLTDPAPMIKLEYLSEDYDEELEMEPRPERTTEVTPPLRTRSPRGNRPSEAGTEENGRREMNLPPLLTAYLGRSEDGQPSRSSLTPIHGGRQSSTNTGGNLPPISTFLSNHAQPFIPNSVAAPNGFVLAHITPTPNSHQVSLMDKPKVSYSQLRPVILPLGEPMPTLHKEDLTGSVTPFVCWIEDYPLPDGLKMPSHILGLLEDQRIFGFVHGLKARNLVEHLSTDLLSTYKGLMEKTYTWIKAREVVTNGAPNDRRDNFESPREILATEKVARSFKQPPRMMGSRRPRYMSTFCYFHEDHGHDTNDSRQLRSHIKEVVRLGQLSHLVKGIKKERIKTSNNQRGEKKEKSTTLAEAPILMINQEEARTRNNISKGPTFEGREIAFPPVTKGSNSSAPVIIKAKIFGRKVGQVHMDSGSSCEIIYEHCFLKLKPSIQASKVDSHVPLVGFSGEKSQAIGEVLLEITIGNASLTRSETLNFVIVSFDRKHKFRFICEKGKRTGSYLLHKQSPTGSRAQLPCTGKTHTSTGIRSEKVAKIFSHTTRDDSEKETPKDFLIEAPPKDDKKEVERKTDMKLEETKLSCELKLYMDKASSSDGSGAGLMLIDPEDSQLLVNQVKGIYAAKQPAIREYLQKIKETLRRFDSYTIEHVRRNQNKKANALSKLALMAFEHLTKEVLVEVLAKRFIKEKEVLQVDTKEEESWITPIHKYLLSGLLLEDPKESRKIRIKAPQ